MKGQRLSLQIFPDLHSTQSFVVGLWSGGQRKFARVWLDSAQSSSRGKLTKVLEEEEDDDDEHNRENQT